MYASDSRSHNSIILSEMTIFFIYFKPGNLPVFDLHEVGHETVTGAAPNEVALGLEELFRVDRSIFLDEVGEQRHLAVLFDLSVSTVMHMKIHKETINSRFLQTKFCMNNSNGTKMTTNAHFFFIFVSTIINKSC